MLLTRSRLIQHVKNKFTKNSKITLSNPLLFPFQGSQTELLPHTFLAAMKSLDVGKVPSDS